MCLHSVLTRGSQWVSITAVWNREVFRYGGQCSKSKWTHRTNVIYWCSVGPRSPKPGEHTGPKTHKWDIDRFERREGKKVIFNREVPHLVHWVVNILSFSASLSLGFTRTLHSTVPWHSTVYVLMTAHRNCPLGAGLTAPQGVQMKRKMWTIKDSLVDVLCTKLHCTLWVDKRKSFFTPVVCIHLFI